VIYFIENNTEAIKFYKFTTPHVKKIYQKLYVNSVNEAIIKAAYFLFNVQDKFLLSGIRLSLNLADETFIAHCFDILLPLLHYMHVGRQVEQEQLA
jgi:hypothetical protein